MYNVQKSPELTASISNSTDRPLVDLYETEGSGGFPHVSFMARPVVGGHFAFLTLERACGGEAIEGVGCLEEREVNNDGVKRRGVL